MQEDYEDYNCVETEIVPCRRRLNLNDDLENTQEEGSFNSGDKDNNSFNKNNESNEEDNGNSLIDYLYSNHQTYRPKVQKIAIMKDIFDTSASSDKNVNVSQLDINCSDSKNGKKRHFLNLTKLKKSFLIKDKNSIKILENKHNNKQTLTEGDEGKTKILKIPNIAHTLKKFSIVKKATNSILPKKTHLVCQTSIHNKSNVVLPSLSMNQSLTQKNRVNTERTIPNKIKIKATALKKHLLNLKDNKELTIFHNYESNTNRLRTIDTASCSISFKKRSINSSSLISKYK